MPRLHCSYSGVFFLEGTISPGGLYTEEEKRSTEAIFGVPLLQVLWTGPMQSIPSRETKTGCASGRAPRCARFCVLTAHVR